jgi:DNA-binding response OmpR family regulator
MFRVMVVEDDSMMSKLLHDLLKSDGYEVVVYNSGQSALHAAPDDKPDIILLDVNLLDMIGHDVCRAVKADPRTRHIPVLMLTGEARELENRIKGLDCGAEDYMFKPFSPKVLLARIKSILAVTNKPSK